MAVVLSKSKKIIDRIDKIPKPAEVLAVEVYIGAGSGSAGLLHGTVIEDLAFVPLNYAFCLPVKIKEWAGKGLDRAHRASLGTVEGAADGLRIYCASLVIENRHRHIVISLFHKIEFAFKRNPIMGRCEGAVRSVGLTVLYRPAGNKLCDGAMPSLGLVVNVSITVPRERSAAEGANDEVSGEIDEMELLARFIR
jgi:hypothetical protein